MTTPAAQAYAKQQTPPTPQVKLFRELAGESCDSCGSEAWVRTESRYSTLQLTWCAHHYTALEAQGHFCDETHVILDERRFLKAAVKAQAGA